MRLLGSKLLGERAHGGVALLATCVLLAGAVTFAGCSGASAGASGPLDTAAAMQDLAGGHDEMPHEHWLREGVASLTLKPEQKTAIDQIESDLNAGHEDATSARKSLRETVALQIEHGAIDRGALAPQIDIVGAAIEKAAAARRTGIDKLHAVLDPAQRNQLVDFVEDKLRHRGFGRDQGDAGAAEPAASEAGRRGHGHSGEGLKKIADDLGLSAEQRVAIMTAARSRLSHDHGDFDKARGERDGMRARVGQMLEAFRGETFSASTTGPSLFNKDKVTHFINRMLDFAEIAVPVLTPEQRARLAAKVRNGKPE